MTARWRWSRQGLQGCHQAFWGSPLGVDSADASDGALEVDDGGDGVGVLIGFLPS